MKKLALVALLIAASLYAHSCDVCGCSAQGLSQGLLPGVSSHFVGLRYHYRGFRSEHPPLFADPGVPQWSEDHFSTAEIWGRWAFLPRFELFAFVPLNYYSINRFEAGTATGRDIQSGLGDVSVLLNSVVMRTRDPLNVVQHKLLAGIGVKAPTGRFGRTDAELGIVIPNMQMGTGSWDFSAVLNYRISAKSWGLNAGGSYRRNAPNVVRYQFGDVTAFNLDFFRLLKLNNDKVVFIPQVSANWQHFAKDYRNKSRSEINEYSGGNFLFASAGIDVYVGAIGFSSKIEIPVYQNFAQGYVKSQIRYSAGITWLINSKS